MPRFSSNTRLRREAKVFTSLPLPEEVRGVMSQPRYQSALESVANVAIGYGVALLSQLIVFPLMGIMVTLRENVVIGVIFTVVSLVRSYFVRRLFNLFHS